MTKAIEELINSGLTPEKIFAEAKRIQEAKVAADAKIKEKITAAKNKVVDSLVEYGELITGETLTAAEKKDLANTLDELTEEFVNMKKAVKKFDGLKNKREDVSDEDIALVMKMLNDLDIKF